MILDPHELKAARIARGVNPKDLAAKSGIHFTMIYRIEKGCRAKAETMRALTEALGIVVEVPRA